MTLTKEQIQVVLNDLYAIDGGLKTHQAELEKIILDIAALRPEAKFDENFRQQLRGLLMARAGELAKEKVQRQPIFNIFGARLSYAIVGGLGVIVIFVAVGYWLNQKGIKLIPGQSQPVSEQAFNKVALADHAFGSLTSEGQSAVPQGLGGGGGVATDNNSQPSSSIAPVPNGLGGGGGVMPPYYTYYKFVYTGAPLELNDKTVEVLRRLGFDQGTGGLASLLNSFGAINIGSFDSLKVQNVNLAEDKDFGYQISLNIVEGSVYISQNSQKWPQPYDLCNGQTLCADRNRVKISDVLADSEVIKIAKDFVASHDIDLDSYGEPEITDTWRVEYEQIADKNQFYIPESANVLFPLKINGQFVYDEGGNKTGMNISVDYQQKKVTAAGNITSQSYESSNYEAETDAAQILKIVEQGGYLGNPYPVPLAKPSASQGTTQTVKELDLEVGTPTIEYVAMSNYASGKTNFLLVPSLIFPITKTPGDTNYWYQKTIVVPLAKELMDQQITPPYRAM